MPSLHKGGLVLGLTSVERSYPCNIIQFTEKAPDLFASDSTRTLQVVDKAAQGIDDRALGLCGEDASRKHELPFRLGSSGHKPEMCRCVTILWSHVVLRLNVHLASVV